MHIPKTERVVLEAGTYPATVRKIEIAEGKYGTQLQWDFEIVGADADTGQQRAWSSMTMTEKNKTGRWVAAILGSVPEELDTDDLWGKPCRISLTVKTGADGTEFNRVDEVFKAAAAKPRATIKPMPESSDSTETPF